MKVELPDPTADLDWSNFRGSIQDIFEANAKAHPHRPCVVETASETTKQRTFTYKQINEASNVLAHYLVDHGIRHGDVVIVYAYRGVDLVIAYMASLRAGATVSIVDPLYPPERQRVYLEVAQPKALVNIRKATVDAGELSTIVRSYIDEELSLVAEVPALYIDDDGRVSGGEREGVDVFETVQRKETSSPGVVTGPDSHPTLSFTSGSEGKPKGVLGRHLSLTYYFPWMKDRFELSENDKFTMLSGIAHDPIQRDIFTPLFLGAQLLVPAREDIQHERLAEWFRRYEATVTHLTPAMLQVVVGGAEAKFPCLRLAFSVGDVLKKRDCNLLRKLAVNCNIINMYGTTETQRAVSYFEVPSSNRDPNVLDNLPDIIPAGRGMGNVQLLVVDRDDRTKICPVGKEGEIYVRAGGLAEAYLADDEKTREKFITSWFVDPEIWVKHYESRDQSGNEPWRTFWKGPRDRLYRTGDIGRYLPSGDVECSGRVDDQVKLIGGFRFELGEINKHLSQHPLIRDSIVVQQRDKDEERRLVAYIVPEFNRWPKWLAENKKKDRPDDGTQLGLMLRFRPLQQEIRQHLKNKVPSYAVPSVFVFLSKLPLNPNGKVDKPALPFPDIANVQRSLSDEDEESWQELSRTEQDVANLWSTSIPGVTAKSIRPENSFFDLGGHSILAQEVLLEVNRKLRSGHSPWYVNGVPATPSDPPTLGLKKEYVPMASLFRNPTLRGFAQEVDSGRTMAKTGKGQEMQDAPSDAYSRDADTLVTSLEPSYPSAPTLNKTSPLTVFLTGATGFLGPYLVREILGRGSHIKVIAHVRAKSANAGMQRLKDTSEAYGIWSPEWESRLKCVTGELGSEKLGLSQGDYSEVAGNADIVIHNGAAVHWVQPYEQLKRVNVQGTIEALELCSTKRPKRFAFVSSTSVLDTDKYPVKSEQSLQSGGTGVLESDTLEDSRSGLGTGYGQSKWVGEYLVREAGRRGLVGATIRPGYILGDSRSGVTNTDDFLIRMLKGCIQLRSRPRILNTINMVPVDHVARLVVSSAIHAQSSLQVVQVTSHPRLQLSDYLGCLGIYGYNVREEDYGTWTEKLEAYVQGGKQKDLEQHALMPLYHFVKNDLPANTRAVELDDANAVGALKADAEWTGEDHSKGAAVTGEIVGRYLAFLCLSGFIPEPTETNGKPLPEIALTDAQKAAQKHVGGRGRAAAPPVSA